MNSKILSIIILTIICSATFLIVLPTINNNLDDPNLIAYFNHDEGYLVDLIWYYYSGEKRDSYQLDADYGLEMIYLSDLARVVLSRFVDFTPSIFALMLRWLHFISWICALIALWFFIGRHFGKGWQQMLSVLLLAVRPAFGYLTINFKPEPLVLLLMILGLDYTLRILEKPCKKHMFVALALAAAAFLIKFSGIFLLPGVIAAIYFSQYCNADFGRNSAATFLKIKHSWILEFLIGTGLIVLPFLFIFFYVRKSAGMTYFQEFGLLQSLFGNKETMFLIFVGLIIVIISLVLFYLAKSKKPSIKNIIGIFNEINSISFIVLSAFFIFILFLGFRWITMPTLFLDTYSFNILDFSGILNMREASANPLQGYLKIVNEKLVSFDLLMVLLLVFYLIVEMRFRMESLNHDKLRYYKRKTLMVILVPIFLLLFSPGRFTYHHLLPFFVILSALSIQGLYEFIDSFTGRKAFKASVVFLVCALFTVDILINAAAMLKLRTYQFHYKEDMVFEITDWWRKTYPADTSIVVDHPVLAYLPPEYKNVKRFCYQKDRAEQLKTLVYDFKPQLIYYNIDKSESKMPPINEILPELKIELVKSFDYDGRYYKIYPNYKFVIYRVFYKNE